MRDEEMIALLALFAVVASRRGRGGAGAAGTSPPGSAPPIVPPDAWGAGWTWPVPDLVIGMGHLYPATITQEFRPGTHAKPHRGVDIMYKRRTAADLLETYRTTPETGGVRAGTSQFFAPPNTPICAARDGTIWSVDTTSRGIAIVIDHGGSWATFYTHLASTAYPPHARGKPSRGAAGGEPTRVLAGETIGQMGADPLDPQKLRHLHFEAWYKGAGNSAAVDLGTAASSPMNAWRRTTWKIDT